MLSLYSNDITSLFVLVDDSLPKELPYPAGGRPAKLCRSELVTILIWDMMMVRSRTWKDLHGWLKRYHQQDFPQIPEYSAFIDALHRVLPDLIWLLDVLLDQQAPVRLVDATMLEVCQLHRANGHQTMQGLADFGKNHQGWHYGLKLHASVNLKGMLCRLVFTPASVYDAQLLDRLLDHNTMLAIGDTLYGAKRMREWVYEQFGTIVLAPPHPKQRTKLMATWQRAALCWRSRIEGVFDQLKTHLGLMSTFARSVRGYFLHYVWVLLGYQVMTLGK